MKISVIIIVVGLKHVKLDDYIGYCSSQVFIILLFRHHCPAHLLFQYLFMSGKCCFLFYVLVFSLRAYCSFHCTKKTQMRDSLLKRPNCPLSRIQNEKKLKNHSIIINNNFLNVFQTFHLSAIFRKFDQFTDDHSPENSWLEQEITATTPTIGQILCKLPFF